MNKKELFQKLKELDPNKEVTIVFCSEREFNIRWWGMAFTSLAIGILVGVVIS